MNIKELAKRFVELRIKRAELNLEMQNLLDRYSGGGELMSSGLQAAGKLEEYEKMNKEVNEISEEIIQIRVQVGEDNQESLINEVAKIPDGGRQAEKYVRGLKYPNMEADVKISRDGVVVEPKPDVDVSETKKGFWGKLFK